MKIVENWCNIFVRASNAIFYLLFTANYLFCWGEKVREEAPTFQIKCNKLNTKFKPNYLWSINPSCSVYCGVSMTEGVHPDLHASHPNPVNRCAHFQLHFNQHQVKPYLLISQCQYPCQCHLIWFDMCCLNRVPHIAWYSHITSCAHIIIMYISLKLKLLWMRKLERGITFIWEAWFWQHMLNRKIFC